MPRELRCGDRIAAYGGNPRGEARPARQRATTGAEAIKWRRLTFTIDGNWHHWLCAIAVTKPAVALVFHKGSLLEDQAGVLRGEGSYLRQVAYHQAAADPSAVTALVRRAIEHQTDVR